jgi:predicted nucleotidyltransferase
MIMEVGMVSLGEIEHFCQQLGEAYSPKRVVLFGSYASGTPREDSDVDLLVTMDYRGNRLRVAADIIRALNPRFAVDLIIRTEEELRERLRQKDDFLAAAMRDGSVLYEAAN